METPTAGGGASPEPAGAHAEVPARVLIVDDDTRSRIVASAQFRGSVNEVRFAASGTEALEIAHDWHPDVVLLDVMMPGLDGFEVCRRMRTDPEIVDSRIFMLTALDDRRSRITAFEAGADDFLTKPLDRGEALARIQAVARINRYRSLLRQHAAARSLLAAGAGEVRPQLEEGLISAALERALGTMRLHVQPIVEVDGRSRTLVAHEALLRNGDPLLAHPHSLLAVAAARGRIFEVGRAVRALAARLLADDRVGGRPLFVNMGLLELTDEGLFDEGDPLRPHAREVVIELTEREAMSEVRDLHERVGRLRRAGFRFAVDDLGGGYSGLNSLALVEPEFVKLDRELVRGVDREPLRQKIVASVVHLCAELGIELIAEGVEGGSESEILSGLGARLQQGYYHGRPAPAAGG